MPIKCAFKQFNKAESVLLVVPHVKGFFDVSIHQQVPLLN
jgi:hypothetical protein